MPIKKIETYTEYGLGNGGLIDQKQYEGTFIKGCPNDFFLLGFFNDFFKPQTNSTSKYKNIKVKNPSS